MKSIAIIKTFGSEYPDVNEITLFNNVELMDKVYIKRIYTDMTVSTSDIYIIGQYQTGKNRLTPLSYIEREKDSFQFTTNEDETITIRYEIFRKVYRQAETNLQDNYIVANQTRIGADYLISVYKSKTPEEWENV